MNSCDICGKDFKFPYLLLRHLNRVTSCSPNKVSVENENNVKEKEKNVNESDKKVNISKKNVISDDKNINNNDEKVTTFQCEKCEKVLKSKLGLYRHNNICKGVHSLECPTCFKTFSNRVSKCRHIKKAKCSPPEKKVDQCKDLEEENRKKRRYGILGFFSNFQEHPKVQKVFQFFQFFNFYSKMKINVSYELFNHSIRWSFIVLGTFLTSMYELFRENPLKISFCHNTVNAW